MPDRTASKVDADGMLVVPVDEIPDAELTALFEAKPEMRKLSGAPRYWSPAYGYWPKPAHGWKVSP